MRNISNFMESRRVYFVALAILAIVPFDAVARQATSGLKLAIRDGDSHSKGSKVYVDVSVTNVSDATGVALRLSNEQQRLKFSSWTQSGDFNGRSALTQVDDNGKKVLFLGAFGSETLTGESIKLGTIEYDVVTPGKTELSEFQLVTGDLLTSDGEVLTLSNLEVEGPPTASYQNSLGQNYPNPFNPATTIEYSIAKDSQVNLSVYNAQGQLVRTLVDGVKPRNNYRVDWDGTDNRGVHVSSGVYFYTLTAGAFTQTRKLVLLK